MTRIGLISDTHGYLDESVFKHFAACDEIWHAGDFGPGVAPALAAGLAAGLTVPGLTSSLGILRGVYGNIDGPEIRSIYPEQIVFTCEEVKVMIRHIGGYPPVYNPETKKQLLLHHPRLFICGHSHILKVIYDDALDCLHINPGAAGKQGWQTVRTIIRLAIDGTNIKDCEVIELSTNRKEGRPLI